MVQTATKTFYNREQEKEAKPQERERRKEKRHAQMLAALPMANPKSLKDKAQGKCLICRQLGHWSKECPNHDKFPKMACYKYQQLGHWVALCPRDPKASRSSTKPSLTMGSTELKQSASASLPVTDNLDRAGAKGTTGCGR